MLLVDHKNVAEQAAGGGVDQLFPLCGSQEHMAAAQGYHTNNSGLLPVLKSQT